ncbi:hypothetical protein Fmac_015294 [Flemingia macrophylla]|uniref:Uncharacterized protein n=1 Tax=Flemingia macrophylla TaxID=520843 RepID=A0ABD1ME79_9FABA
MPVYVARVCGIRSSNDHHTSVCPSSQQSGFGARKDANVIRGVHDVATIHLLKLESWKTTTAAETRHLIEKMAPNSCIQSARNDVIVIRGVQDVAIDTSAEARKLEGKLDALVNLVTHLVANRSLPLVARVCGILSSNFHHTSVCPYSKQSGAVEHPEAYAIHLLKLECWKGKLDTLVNLVTQLAVNQKPTSIGRVCGIRSSNNHHTSVCHSSQQSGVDEHPEAYAANTYSRPPQARDKAHDREYGSQILAVQSARNNVIAIREIHDMATIHLAGRQVRCSCELGDLACGESNRPAYVARVCGIRFSNDHHISFSARNDVIVIREIHDVATDTSAEGRKLEGKLDALVNMVTLLVVNQKPASVARVYDIRSSNDHHNSVCPSLQQSGVFSARNDVIVIRGVLDVATDTSAEARKLEGKLDALVILVTHLAANRSPASLQESAHPFFQ